MPNWVKTIVKTKPDVLKDILKKYSNEDGFSFEKVIPMPKELDVERGSRGQDGLMYLFLENDNGISKEKINQVFRSLNPFFSDIYKEKRFKMVEEKYSEDKKKKEDIVLAQSVKEKEKVEKGKTITLTVNKISKNENKVENTTINEVTNTTTNTNTTTTNTTN